MTTDAGRFTSHESREDVYLGETMLPLESGGGDDLSLNPGGSTTLPVSPGTFTQPTGAPTPEDHGGSS